MRWFERAADAGHGMAQQSLALAYLLGQGVAKDEVRALMWFELAAESGEKDSAGLLADLHKEIGKAKADEARQLAQAWRESHAARTQPAAAGRRPLPPRRPPRRSESAARRPVTPARVRRWLAAGAAAALAGCGPAARRRRTSC